MIGPYHKGKMMRSLISFVLWQVSVLVRRQQLAPKFSVSSFQGGQVYRKTQGVANAFQDTIKVVVSRWCSNCWHFQIMKLIHGNQLFFQSQTWGTVVCKIVCSWSWRNKNKNFKIKIITYLKVIKHCFSQRGRRNSEGRGKEDWGG